MYDNVFLFRLAHRVAVYLFAVVVALFVSTSARADVATPPPSAPTQPVTIQTNIKEAPHNFPSTNALIRRGYDFETGTLNVQKKPSKQQFGSVQNGVATKSNPVRITDSYGNVARTTVQTQTQLPANNKLNQMATGAIYGQIAGNIVNSQNAKQAARDLAHGNYGSAAVNAAAAFDAFNIGSGLYGLFDEYANAKAAIADPLHEAARAKAEAAERAAAREAEASGNNPHVLPDLGQFVADPQTGMPAKYPKLIIFSGHLKGSFIVPDLFMASGTSYGDGYIYHKGRPTEMHFFDTSQKPFDESKKFSFRTVQVNEKNYHEYKDMINEAIQRATPPAQLTIEDFLLNDAEIQAVIANALTQMLNNQQENTAAIKDLTNMLWANNLLNESNTQTTVAGTAADNTVLSEPYTPAGSNQAQQTQHVINKNGSITTSIIPRPDLKPNSRQAPTKTKLKGKDRDDDDESGTTTKKDDNDDSGTSSQKRKEDKEDEEICNEENQDRLLCVKAGSDVYKDLEIPSETVEIDFKKDTYFAEKGSCPAPVKFSFLGEHEISYEPLCDLARGLRPIVELLGVLTAMGIAYGAVREL